jgi:hypothetical protein
MNRFDIILGKESSFPLTPFVPPIEGYKFSIIGPRGSGKTTYLFNDMMAHLDSNNQKALFLSISNENAPHTSLSLRGMRSGNFGGKDVGFPIDQEKLLNCGLDQAHKYTAKVSFRSYESFFRHTHDVRSSHHLQFDLIFMDDLDSLPDDLWAVGEPILLPLIEKAKRVLFSSSDIIPHIPLYGFSSICWKFYNAPSEE